MTFGSRGRLLCALSLVIAIFTFSSVSSTQAQTANGSLYTGTVRLACEALLCLSSSAGGPDCNPALSYFYGIKERKLSDTLDARHSFLQQCPDASLTPQMASLARAISRGAGRCDAAAFNRALGTVHIDRFGKESVRISNKAPTYCNAYVHHEYTDLAGLTPRYVGTVEEGGYWVEPKNYDAELIKYQAELEARKKAEEREQDREGHDSGSW